MRPLLLTLAAASVFAADTSKLRIGELAKAGEAMEVANVPALAAEAYARPHTTEVPSPVYRLSDISFLGAERKEKLDLYFPSGALSADRPNRAAVVFIHGGGFTGGDKAEYRSASVSADLCRAGYVVVSCNYVLGSKTKEGVWPQNIADCRNAVRWVRAHAKELGVDPARIAVGGGSAGGYLALMVGLSDDRTGPGGDPAAKISAKVSGVIDMYGVVNFAKHGKGEVPGVSAEAQQAYLPTYQADMRDPPVLILHGTADTTVDISESDELAAALVVAKLRFDYIRVTDAPHTFDLHPKGKGWKRDRIDYDTTGVPGMGKDSSDKADVTAPTLEFLSRTIGK
jgi:acetyl esterase/lipase